MQYGRTVWTEGDELGLAKVAEGQFAALATPVGRWALRRDERPEPLAVGTVVQVQEVRHYGAALCREVVECPDTVRAGAELATLGLYEMQADHPLREVFRG